MDLIDVAVVIILLLFLALSAPKRVPKPMNRNLFIWISVRFNLCESYVVARKRKSESEREEQKTGKIRLSAELKSNKNTHDISLNVTQHHEQLWQMKFFLWFHYFMKSKTKNTNGLGTPEAIEPKWCVGTKRFHGKDWQVDGF